MDANLLIALAKDIETLIVGGSVGRRVPHKAFAEAYYLHQASLAGKMATDYHVQRLRGIGSLRHAIWPPQQFHTVPARTAVPNKRGVIENVEGAGYVNGQIIRNRRYPNLAASSRKPAIIVNAAIAIFNASVTGSKHAVFGILLAGREWPFTNDSMAQLLPNPMSIAGPTLTATVMIVDIDDTEQVSHFLARREAELGLLRRYQHVPLDFATQLEPEDRAVWEDSGKWSTMWQTAHCQRPPYPVTRH